MYVVPAASGQCELIVHLCATAKIVKKVIDKKEKLSCKKVTKKNK